MSKKIGRPTSSPRVVQVRIRMSEEESALLTECADKLDTTKTNVIVTGIRKVYADIKK